MRSGVLPRAIRGRPAASRACRTGGAFNGSIDPRGANPAIVPGRRRKPMTSVELVAKNDPLRIRRAILKMRFTFAVLAPKSRWRICDERHASGPQKKLDVALPRGFAMSTDTPSGRF